MGGIEASRGFLYQGIASVLVALTDKRSWDKIYVEYPTSGDKVDIALEEKGEIVKCIQVKSSKNTFVKADIQKWITDLVNDCKSLEYEIFLIGQCDNKANIFIKSIEKYYNNALDREAEVSLEGFDTSLLDHKRICFSVLPFDIEKMNRILRDSLHEYISYKQYQKGFEQIKLIANAMVEEQMYFSACEHGIGRTEFEEMLEKRLSLFGDRHLPKRISIAVISFANGAAELEEETESHLSLIEMFNERELKNEYRWNEVYIKVEKFLRENTNNKAAYQLYLTKTHYSIAFAAGRILNSKSGIHVFPVQNTSTNGAMLWDVKPGERADHCNWKVESEQLQAGQVDSALILNITRDIKNDVIRFINHENLPIGRMISCIPREKGATNISIIDGTHASLLANDVYKAINDRSMQERRAVIHIFASAPNGFMFFLGQNSVGFGKCILYEYDFEQKRSCTYSQSMSFIN